MNDGGKAFPRRMPNIKVPPDEILDLVNEYGGMTLRDYLAAHAPAEPQWDFVVNIRPRPTPVFPDQPDDGGSHVYYDPINVKDLETWDLEYTFKRAAQWPWAWADAVLAAREQP